MIAIDAKPYTQSTSFRELYGVEKLPFPESWQKHEIGYLAETFSNDTLVCVFPPQDLTPHWTPKNKHLHNKLDELSLKYQGKYENRPVFTFDAEPKRMTIKELLPGIEIERLSLLGENSWLGHKLTQKIVGLNVGVTSYHEAIAHATGDLPEMMPPNIFLISGRVVTSDGYFLFGRRNSAYSMGKIGCFGGTYDFDMDKVQRTGYIPQPTDVMALEIIEELGLKLDNISQNQTRAIYYDSLKTNNGTIARRPVLLHDVKLNIPLEEIVRKFNASASTKEEHTELVAVLGNTQQVLETMRKHDPHSFHEPAGLILASILALASGLRV